MKRQLSHKIQVLILSSLVLFLSPCKTLADEIYRETFGFCGEFGSAAAALNTNWQALRVGKTLGAPGYLKVFGPGSPKIFDPINSNPQGPSQGHAFWSKATRSMLFITDEYQVDVRDLYRISYQQRMDAKVNGRPKDESKLALLIGDTWYIADHGHRQHHVGFWEPARFHPHEITYGTSRHIPGHGIARPENANELLPASGTVSMFGIYFKKIRGKVRFDNFTIEDFKQSGLSAKADPLPSQCQFTTALPRQCKASRFDRARYKFSKRARRKVLRKLRGSSAKVIRDKAIISLLINTGIRTYQAAELQLDDYQATGSELASITVRDHINPLIRLSGKTEQLLNAYLGRASETLLANGTVFLDYSKQSKSYLPQRMCPQQIHRVIRRRAKRARVWGAIRVIRKR